VKVVTTSIEMMKSAQVVMLLARGSALCVYAMASDAVAPSPKELSIDCVKTCTEACALVVQDAKMCTDLCTKVFTFCCKGDETAAKH
jgi:hypothetical protein